MLYLCIYYFTVYKLD